MLLHAVGLKITLVDPHVPCLFKVVSTAVASSKKEEDYRDM